MTIFPRVLKTLIYLTAVADVTHRKESMKRLRERNGSCVSLFDGTGSYGKIIIAVCKKALQKNIGSKDKKKIM